MNSIFIATLLVASSASFAAQNPCPDLTGNYDCKGNVQDFYSGTNVTISQKPSGNFTEYALPSSDSRNDVDLILSDSESHSTGTDESGGMEIGMSYSASCSGQVLTISRYASGIEVYRDTKLSLSSDHKTLIISEVLAQGSKEKKSSSKCKRTH